jgi:16S rRNA (adenine1518-N6/adenine1519-N6)-dimethyltransferase
VSRSELRELLTTHGLRLRRELGQNFIADQHTADRLSDLAGVEPGECVIEVGAGLGMFTRALARRGRRVLSVEIDSGLVRVLTEQNLLPENVELIHADALDLDLSSLIESLRGDEGAPVRLVANLPFSAASPLLRRLLDRRDQLVNWCVVLQKEVAERLFAPVDCREYGSLAVLHHLCAELEGSSQLTANCFFPAPKVDSVFVRIRRREGVNLSSGELARVERVARAAFGQRRKTISNALRGGGFGSEEFDLPGAFERAEVAPGARAETLAPDRFVALARELLPVDSDAAC